MHFKQDLKINMTRIFALVFACILIFSCNQGGQTSYNETPTRGSINISVDESFQMLLDTEIYTFTSLYPYAKIKARYGPEFDVINDLMNDSARLVVSSKPLTDLQIQILKDTLVIARTTKIAFDALAIIVHKENPDSLMTYSTIKNIFLGKTTHWNEINPKSKSEPISVVFDNYKSGNVRYFKEKFGITGNLPSNFYALNSNTEVIRFIEKNRNAMGVISVNWISDKDDPTYKNFTRNIHVAAISGEYFPDDYYRPEQGSIYNKSYPFTREVYIISRETFHGLGSGFTMWLAAEQGQRIILKSGLVPATMPIRLIQVKKN